MTALVATALVVIAVGSLGLAVTRYIKSSRTVNPPLSPQQRLEAAVRNQAAAWVVQQVSHSTKVSCDQVMCNVLKAAGFPSPDLRVPTPGNLSGSEVVVATQAVRDQFGSLLGSYYAPQVLADMGSGDAEITIRLTAATSAAAQVDLPERKSFGAGLLQFGVTASASAKKQLLAGQVDSRLLLVINGFMTQSLNFDIVQFGNVGPGAGQGIPFRYADLALSGKATDMTSSAYLRSIRADLAKVPAPGNTASASIVPFQGGQTVLRIAFTAPSPAGVLGASKPH